MAQKTEKEETGFKVVSETITLYVKCGVAGNYAANDLCKKCFSAIVAGSASTVIMAAVGSKKLFRSSSSSRSSLDRKFNPIQIPKDLKKEDSDSMEAVQLKRVLNWCSGCRKKVGLTGFRCRCGELFCADHSYSNRHDYSYDYKVVGREAIERENPVVKAAKIVKI